MISGQLSLYLFVAFGSFLFLYPLLPVPLYSFDVHQSRCIYFINRNGGFVVPLIRMVDVSNSGISIFFPTSSQLSTVVFSRRQ